MKNKPLEATRIKPDEVKVAERDKVTMFHSSVQFEKVNQRRAEKKRLNNLGLMTCYERQGRFIMAKCSGQLQPDTFLKEFSYSTGD